MNKENTKLFFSLKKIEKILPRNIYLFCRDIYDNLVKAKNIIYSWISYPILYFFNKSLKKQNRYLIPIPSTSVGDMLVFTSLENDPGNISKFHIIHQNKEIFKNLKVKNTFLRKGFLNRQKLQFFYSSTHSNILGKSSRKPPKDDKMHLRDAFFYKRKNLYNVIKKIPKNVKIVFNKDEKRSYELKFKDILKKDFALIISENNYSGFSRVKNWGNRNMQSAINQTKNKINWIQVGMIYDSRLAGTIADLRGKTNLRELFFLASKARLILTTEGMLTHVSSAFNVPCVSICSGFISPKVSEYSNTISVTPHPLPSCAYCKSPICIYERPICLENIKLKDVVKEIRKVLKHN